MGNMAEREETVKVGEYKTLSLYCSLCKKRGVPIYPIGAASDPLCASCHAYIFVKALEQ